MGKRTISVSLAEPVVFQTDMSVGYVGSLHFVNNSIHEVTVQVFEGNIKVEDKETFDASTFPSVSLEQTTIPGGDAHLVKYLNNPVAYLTVYVTTGAADGVTIDCYEHVRG